MAEPKMLTAEELARVQFLADYAILSPLVKERLDQVLSHIAALTAQLSAAHEAIRAGDALVRCRVSEAPDYMDCPFCLPTWDGKQEVHGPGCEYVGWRTARAKVKLEGDEDA